MAIVSGRSAVGTFGPVRLWTKGPALKNWRRARLVWDSSILQDAASFFGAYYSAVGTIGPMRLWTKGPALKKWVARARLVWDSRVLQDARIVFRGVAQLVRFGPMRLWTKGPALKKLGGGGAPGLGLEYIAGRGIVFRGVAQLVARLVWDQEVAGSNPVAPIFIVPLAQRIERQPSKNMDIMMVRFHYGTFFGLFFGPLAQWHHRSDASLDRWPRSKK